MIRGEISRRQALAALAASPSLLWGLHALALGADSKVRLTHVRYAGANPVPRPNGLGRLAWELDKRTSIDVAAETPIVGLADKQLFDSPFLVWGGDRAFEMPSPADLGHLRRHLLYGGFLLIDSAEARPGGGFDRSTRQLVSQLFGPDALTRITPPNILHETFYLLDRAVGRVASVPYLEGVERDGRTLLVYSQNDLGGAWSRDNLGQWEFSVFPGGERQRELAFRWGINLVMYALCGDYKADQVHIPFILKRRRWRTP